MALMTTSSRYFASSSCRRLSSRGAVMRSHQRSYNSSSGSSWSSIKSTIRNNLLLQQQPRSFATSSSYTSYEYPWAKEEPEITRTKASDVQHESVHSELKLVPAEDHFDDAGKYSPTDVKSMLETQKKTLKTALTAGASVIAETPPANVPPNVPADQLEVPTTKLTTLGNGVRVVSQETYGQVSTVGVVSELASRKETPQQTGMTHVLELLAFGATKEYSAEQVTTSLQQWGGTQFVATGREQSLHCVDLLRPNVPQALHLLQQVLLEPQFLEEELEEAKMALMFQRDQIHFAGGDGPNPRKPDAATELVDSVIPPDMLLSEALQTAAYGADQPLGQPHVCPPQAMVGMTRTGVMDFWQQHVVGNPGGLVVGGAGVCHDELVDLAARSFGHLQQQEQTADKVTEYRGGEARWQLPGTPQSPIDEYGWIRVCVAFPVEGGWHSSDLVPACVLQTLLGGGSSFSAGGPGKGMYSRLYRQVLNRYGWAESAEAFSAFYQETGLWGISGSVKDARKAGDMVRVLAEHLARLAVDPVSDEELNRARNMLRCNVLTQLESRLVLFEDMARQVLTYGQREDMLTTCAKIDAVTAADVQHMAQKALQHAPTLASTGVDLQHVPRYDEVSRWFR